MPHGAPSRRQHATRTSPFAHGTKADLDLAPFLCPHRWVQWCCWTRASTCLTAPPTCRRWAATSWWRRVRQAAGCAAAAAAATHSRAARSTPALLRACLLRRCFHSAYLPCNTWEPRMCALHLAPCTCPAGHKMLAPTASGFMWGRYVRERWAAQLALPQRHDKQCTRHHRARRAASTRNLG